MKVTGTQIPQSGQQFVYRPTRRRFLHALGAAAGLMVPNLLPSSAEASDIPPHALRFTTSDGRDPGRKAVIVYMQGGLSNFDTFDPKTHSKIKGPFEKIDTAARDIKLTEVLQPLARQAGNMVVINNLHSRIGTHAKAAANVMTGSEATRGNDFLSPAANMNPFIEFADLLTNQASRDVGYAVIHQNSYDREGYNRVWRTPWGGINHDAATAVYAPYDTEIGGFTNPFGGTTNVSLARFRQRAELLETFDNSGHTLIGDSIDRHNRAYGQAMSLLDGDFNEAFDLSREPLPVQEKYGRSKVGKQMLLAKRMLQAGARVVVANDGNYDNHWGIEVDYGRMLPPFARALSALVDDIKLMDERVDIIIVTEFGRTPGMTGTPGSYQYPGRHHWPNAFSMAVISNDREAIGGGRTIGRTNNDGEIVGQEFDASMIGETILDLLGLGRYETRGEVVTGIRFPYIDIKNERVVS